VTASTTLPVTTELVHRKWATRGLVLPVAIISGLVGLGSLIDAFVPDIGRGERAAFAVAAVLGVVVSARSIVAGFVVTNGYVRVRGIWATRTVPRDQVAGFVMECDAADHFNFPAVVAVDGRRIRARWAFRRAGQGGSRRVSQEIVDLLSAMRLYDETRLDTALNEVDAVRREAITAYRWNSPPGWPTPPPGWRPLRGWAPPPEWPPPPVAWQFWEPMAIPVVTAADVEVDPAEVPAGQLPANLDARYALDVEVAQGLPGSNWGIGEALQSFGWLALLIGLTVPVDAYVSGRAAAFLGESSIGIAVVLAARKAAAQSGGWRRALGWDLPKPSDAWFSLRWFGWNTLGRFVAGLFLAIITLPLRGKATSNVDVSRNDSVLTIVVLIVIAVLLAPVVEEFFFRGLLLRAGMRRYSFWPAAIVSSALFGLAHVWQVDSPRARVILGGSIAVFGLVQCLLVRRKARLGPNMLVHGFANALVVAFVLL
jgi:hypothetical protein